MTCGDEVEGLETFDMRLTLKRRIFTRTPRITLGRDKCEGLIIDSTTGNDQHVYTMSLIKYTNSCCEHKPVNIWSNGR